MPNPYSSLVSVKTFPFFMGLFFLALLVFFSSTTLLATPLAYSLDSLSQTVILNNKAQQLLKKQTSSKQAVPCTHSGCQQHLQISGQIEDIGEKSLILNFGYLDYWHYFKNLGKTTTDSLGYFSFEAHLPSEAIVRIHGLSPQPIQIISDQAQIHLYTKNKKSTEVGIAGSPASLELQQLLQKEKNRNIEPTFYPQYIDTTSHTLLAYLAIKKIAYSEHPEKYLKMVDRMEKDFPNTRLSKDFALMVKQKLESENFMVGKTIPDIKLPSPDGKFISLYQTLDENEYVLLYFWASWCGPCRKELPNVKALIEKHQQEGEKINIYFVSLDINKSKWTQAIEQTGLSNGYHVSDLKKWDSIVTEEFLVKSIPYSYLLDKQGRIISKNLRKEALADELLRVFSR